MRKKVFSVAALTLVCSISLIALGNSNGYVDNLFDSVKNYSVLKVFTAEEKNNSKKTIIREPKSQSVVKSSRIADAAPAVPDNIVYFILFNHLVGLKKQVDEQAQLTDDTPLDYYDLYKRQANLNDFQSQSLFQTAQNCVNAVKPIDEQAKSIIDQERAAIPGGIIEPMSADPRAAGAEQTVPPAPWELIELQQQKDDTVLYYRDQLRSNLGEGKFAEFNQFAREKIAPQVETLTSASLEPKREVR